MTTNVRPTARRRRLDVVDVEALAAARRRGVRRAAGRAARRSRSRRPLVTLTVATVPLIGAAQPRIRATPASRPCTGLSARCRPRPCRPRAAPRSCRCCRSAEASLRLGVGEAACGPAPGCLQRDASRSCRAPAPSSPCRPPRPAPMSPCRTPPKLSVLLVGGLERAGRRHRLPPPSRRLHADQPGRRRRLRRRPGVRGSASRRADAAADQDDDHRRGQPGCVRGARAAPGWLSAHRRREAFRCVGTARTSRQRRIRLRTAPSTSCESRSGLLWFPVTAGSRRHVASLPVVHVLLPPSEAKSAGGRGRPLARPATAPAAGRRARRARSRRSPTLTEGDAGPAAAALLLPPAVASDALAAECGGPDGADDARTAALRRRGLRRTRVRRAARRTRSDSRGRSACDLLRACSAWCAATRRCRTIACRPRQCCPVSASPARSGGRSSTPRCRTLLARRGPDRRSALVRLRGDVAARARSRPAGRDGAGALAAAVRRAGRGELPEQVREGQLAARAGAPRRRRGADRRRRRGRARPGSRRRRGGRGRVRRVRLVLFTG